MRLFYIAISAILPFPVIASDATGYALINKFSLNILLSVILSLAAAIIKTHSNNDDIKTPFQLFTYITKVFASLIILSLIILQFVF